MRWLIYAMGGGFGHLTRATALARATPTGIDVRILTNSPYVSSVRKAMPDLDITAIDPGIEISAARRQVLQHIDSVSPDCLIVDAFPRGLGGELAELMPSFKRLRVLVRRDLNPRYAAAYELNAFVDRAYDLVFDVETQPWLVRSPHDTLSRDRAREVLDVFSDRRCVVVCASGNATELAWYGSVAAQLYDCDVRCIAPVCPRSCPPELWRSYWPAMDLLQGADVVFGSAGYNTIYECLAMGVPLVARPWERMYDRQRLRAVRAAERGGVTIVGTAEEAVAAVLSAPSRQLVPQFRNGATDAAALIAATATER